jgi:hypothetical protein
MIGSLECRFDIPTFALILRFATLDPVPFAAPVCQPRRKTGRLVAIRSIHVFAMMTRLPHSDEAILDIRKIEDYCLSPSHPRGRHKARVFREALDLQRSDAAWLRDVLLEAARSSEASPIAVDSWDTHWRLDATIRRQRKSAVVRTI